MSQLSEFEFAKEEKIVDKTTDSWKVLIVDDENQVHDMTKLSLGKFIYAGKSLAFTSAYSAKDAIALLSKEDDFVVVILDIVMENSRSGLEVVEYIRNVLKNRTMRIIIRTGEPGEESQRFIVDNYDINDYREKSELTIDQLYTSLRTSLVQYEQISELDQTKDALTELNSGLQLCINKAVDQQKQKQSEEFQHSRLVQMNELLNMLAHQWRQPLSRISTTVANIKLQIALDTYDINNIDLDLEKVDDHIQELSTTINSFRAIYKVDNGFSVSRVDKILLDTVDLMRPLFQDDFFELKVDVECAFPAGTNNISQVFLNLIKNAHEEFIFRETSNGCLHIHAYKKDDEFVIDLEDNAGGISEDIIEKIFDPYFSTKLKRHGIGLGLFTAKTIIQEHYQGSLSFKNTKDGACFTITMPKQLEVSS